MHHRVAYTATNFGAVTTRDPQALPRPTPLTHSFTQNHPKQQITYDWLAISVGRERGDLLGIGDLAAERGVHRDELRGRDGTLEDSRDDPLQDLHGGDTHLDKLLAQALEVIQRNSVQDTVCSGLEEGKQKGEQRERALLSFFTAAEQRR